MNTRWSRPSRRWRLTIPESAPSDVTPPAPPCHASGSRNTIAAAAQSRSSRRSSADGPARTAHRARSHMAANPAAKSARTTDGAAASHAGRHGSPASNQRTSSASQATAAANPAARPGSGLPSLTRRPSPARRHEHEIERVTRGERPRGQQEADQRDGPRAVPPALQPVELRQRRQPVEQELEVQAGGLPYLEAVLD